VPKKFAAMHWVKMAAEKTKFILGDTCVFGMREDGHCATLLRFGSGAATEWKEIYMPVSSDNVLVGMRARSEPSLRPNQINEASAAVSLTNIYSSFVDDDVRSMANSIGSRTDLLTKDEIEKIVSDVWDMG
jgi:hypothetical protein